MGHQILKYINVVRLSPPNILQGYSTQKCRLLTINAHQYHTSFVNRQCMSSTRLYLPTYAAQLKHTKSSKPNSLFITRSFSRKLSSKPEQLEKSLTNEDKDKLDPFKQFKSNMDPYLRLIRFDRPIGKEMIHSPYYS